MKTAEFTITITVGIAHISEEKVFPEDPWRRVWLVYFSGSIPNDEAKQRAIDVARQAISEKFDVPLDQLEGVMGELPSNIARVHIPK